MAKVALMISWWETRSNAAATSQSMTNTEIYQCCCLFHHPSEHPDNFVRLSTRDVTVLRVPSRLQSLSWQLLHCLGVETIDRRQHGNRAKTAHRELAILFSDHSDLLCFPQLFCLLGSVVDQPELETARDGFPDVPVSSMSISTTI